MYYVKRQKGLHLDLTLHEIKNFHMVMKERGRGGGKGGREGKREEKGKEQRRERKGKERKRSKRKSKQLRNENSHSINW